MPTTPFGAALEAALKGNSQGGRLYMCSGVVVNPRYFCCISGTSVGINKDPVAIGASSPLQGCADPLGVAGTTFSVDVTNSYSPSSTINTYEIDWGDGNSTGALAWPQAAPDTHMYTLGGVTEPIIYTITITVTDLLGATGLDTIDVEIWDCDVYPAILAYAGCGSSGVWFTQDGGFTWVERGGGLLEGVRINDLKVNPFTVVTGTANTSTLELWAATENGLYKTTNGGDTWGFITLPSPGDNFTPVAVLPSKIDENEIFVVVNTDSQMYLYRSTDGGTNWTRTGDSVRVDLVAPTIESNVFGGGAFFNKVRKFAVYAGDLYTFDPDTNNEDVAVRNDANGTWSSIGDPGVTDRVTAIIAGDGAPYRLWVTGRSSGVGVGIRQRAWNGAAWVTIDANMFQKDDIYELASGNIIVSTIHTNAGPTAVREFTSAGALVANYQIHPGTVEYILTEYAGTIFALTSDTPIPGQSKIKRHIAGNNWADEFEPLGGVPGVENGFVEANGVLYAMSNLQLMVRNNVAQTWSDDVFSFPIGTVIESAFSYNNEVYVGTAGSQGGGQLWRRDPVSGYVLVGSADSSRPGDLDSDGIVFHDNQWLLSAQVTGSSPTGNLIYRVPEQDVIAFAGTNGSGLTLDMSADGQYIYLATLSGGATPVIYRLPRDMTSATILYNVGGGSWAGVVADYNLASRVWIYGDFGNGNAKILGSDDFGDTLVDVTPAAWANDEFVRPVFLSVYDPGDVVATLNTALETWQTLDAGTTWIQSGVAATPFAAQSGDRDFIDDQILLLGRFQAGANHLQISPNLGFEWEERSSGITANAPITSIIIVG